jgi:hypothetical protein
MSARPRTPRLTQGCSFTIRNDVVTITPGDATAGALFPGGILVTDLRRGLLIVSKVGPRVRGETHGVTNLKLV